MSHNLTDTDSATATTTPKGYHGAGQADSASSRWGPLLVTLLAMVAFGVYLRLLHLGIPGDLTLDEHHFVRNARNYLSGLPDWNDHPPLGKLLIAVAIATVGDTSLAWRLVPAGLGIAVLGLVFVLGRGAFSSRTVGAAAAAFAAVDGFLIAYSRTALLDGVLLFFMLSAMVVVLRARRELGFACAGALVGAAMSVKFSGVVVLVPLFVAAVTRAHGWRTLSCPLVAVLAAGAAYVGVFSFGLGVTSGAAGPTAVWDRTLELYRHHAELTEWSNRLVSHWYQWFLPTKPFTLYREVVPDGTVRMMTTLGNPLLWWSAPLSVAAASVAAMLRGGALVRKGQWRGAFDDRVLLLSLWFAGIAPWWISARDSYVYHYLPSYSVGLVILAGSVGSLKRGRFVPLGFCLAALCAAAWYAPLWSKMAVRQEVVETRLFLSTWRP